MERPRLTLAEHAASRAVGADSPATSSCRGARPSGRCAGWRTCGSHSGTQPSHLVFFLHDEVIVHAPAELAEEVADAIRESAAAAGRLLFGELPVTFPVTTAIVDNYGQAK